MGQLLLTVQLLQLTEQVEATESAGAIQVQLMGLQMVLQTEPPMVLQTVRPTELRMAQRMVQQPQPPIVIVE